MYKICEVYIILQPIDSLYYIIVYNEVCTLARYLECISTLQFSPTETFPQWLLVLYKCYMLFSLNFSSTNLTLMINPHVKIFRFVALRCHHVPKCKKASFIYQMLNMFNCLPSSSIKFTGMIFKCSCKNIPVSDWRQIL